MTNEMIKTEYGNRLRDVEFIWARNSKEFLFANSILIRGNPTIIVDPSATFTYIEGLALSHSVNIVFNTHYHGDHRSLNALFKDVIYASHELDAPAIRSYEVYEKYSDSDPNSIYSQWRHQVFEKYHIQDCPVSKLYKGGETIETDTTQIELIHIPGHTPGHLALYFKNLDCLYLSDIDITPYGPWYANVASNIDDFIASVDRMRKFEAKHYVTSHGERIYTPEEYQKKIERFYAFFQERDEKILELLKEGPKELAYLASEGIIYRKGALSDPLKAYFQWQMLQKHLDRLIRLKAITQDGFVYSIK